ncbi:AraC family transcriptional regulator [Marinilongibacter aquaticus]|uniref:AraC family transcriptional regulator n=1 Tax=Marinilongibacter aquaticus TaxID=2975157 RepID=UPI0021BD2863|nr:AraC family transcriptional regulator [Marinilongibacter aquaticus]UBM57314.1 AraC family transcriptional regulator [Marinilongibacter aquaticus]
MKPQLLKISYPHEYSFNLFELCCPYFPTPWHYHPEVEIVYIKDSKGERLVGSSITEFGPGDLCMKGAFVPHCYRNSSEYFDGREDLRAASLSLQFTEDFLGPGFMERPENFKLRKLILNAKRGILFKGDIREKVCHKMEMLAAKEGVERIIGILDILGVMSCWEDYTYLSSEPMILTNTQDSDRIQRVFEHVTEQFKQDIKLADVASLAHMSESAFSRYFKKRTQKTFSTFLTEVRIEHACKLLQKDQLSVSEVSYQSGFNNLSNFNRQFKAVKKTTPLNYRARFLG